MVIVWLWPTTTFAAVELREKLVPWMTLTCTYWQLPAESQMVRVSMPVFPLALTRIELPLTVPIATDGFESFVMEKVPYAPLTVTAALCPVDKLRTVWLKDKPPFPVEPVPAGQDIVEDWALSTVTYVCELLVTL